MVPAFAIPRFPTVDPSAPHYESFYLTATDPATRRALWIRHTVHQVPGRAATASVWFTLFGPDGPQAAKVTVDRIADQSGPGIAIGDLARVDLAGAHGALRVGDLDARWDLTFDEAADPLAHLSKPWMYAAGVPRTKSTSPAPDLAISGSLTLNGETIMLRRWRGMLGHNWGTEHAHRWIWLRGAGFADDPSAWLDVVIGRIKVAGITSPWIANGVLNLDGRRHRVGGARRFPRITERHDGADIVLAAPGLALDVRVGAPRELSVGWSYADPGGGVHQVRNCSVASMDLTATRADGAITRLSTDHGAVYELGTKEFDPLIAMQPYGDG